MANFEFNPIADVVTLRILCPKCGEEFLTEGLGVPSPDWAAETHHDSIQTEDYEQQCEHCGECFNVTLYNGFYGGDGEIDVVDSEVDMKYSNILEVIEDFPEDESYDYDKDLFDISHADVSDILSAIEFLPIPIKEKLYKLLYLQLIINLETYLGDTLKYYVLDNEIYLCKFVEAYEPFQKEKLKFSDICKKYEKRKDIVNKALSEILYHKLHIVRKLYKAILNVNLGDISELSKAIQRRHDIVHRNGKEVNGAMFVISKDDVEQLAKKTKTFIDDIDTQLPSDKRKDFDELF